MKIIYYDGLIYFKAKLDIALINDAPNFCDLSILLKKKTKFRGVQNESLRWIQWGALVIPKIMVFTIVG
jgi:hypothetical protein